MAVNHEMAFSGRLFCGERERGNRRWKKKLKRLKNYFETIEVGHKWRSRYSSFDKLWNSNTPSSRKNFCNRFQFWILIHSLVHSFVDLQTFLIESFYFFEWSRHCTLYFKNIFPFLSLHRRVALLWKWDEKISQA